MIPTIDLSDIVPELKVSPGAVDLAVAMTTLLYTNYFQQPSSLALSPVLARVAAEGLATADPPPDDWKVVLVQQLTAVVLLFELGVSLTIPAQGLPQFLAPDSPEGLAAQAEAAAFVKRKN